MNAIKCKNKSKEIKDIVILTSNVEGKFKLLMEHAMSKYDFLRIKKGNYYSDIPKDCNNVAKHNVYFKFYNLTLETEPYIYVDADAIITESLDKAVLCSKDKPFICVDHQTIKGHTDHIKIKFLNSGFMIVSDPSFLNFNSILNTKITYNTPGTDQRLIFNYCKNIYYDYTHNEIHYGYNSCSGFIKVVNNNIISSGIPEKHDIYVVHYWYHYKPWIKCECCVNGKNECPLYNDWLSEIDIFFA
jgi:lipopolysaccharide biosynthesis glycosyltransferase